MTSSKPAEPAVLMIVSTLHPPGGAELQAFRLAEALNARGCRTEIMTYGGPSSGPEFPPGVVIHSLHGPFNRALSLFSRARKAAWPAAAPAPAPRGERDFSGAPAALREGSAIRRFGWRSAPYALACFLDLCLFMLRRRGEYRVLHSHHLEWDAFMAALAGRLFGLKVLVKDSTMNGIIRLESDLMGPLMKRFLAANCGFIATTGTIEENFLAAGIPRERIFRIPNAVSVPAETGRANAAGADCLFVGNLTQQPAKGFDVLLKAFVEVVRARPDAKLEVIGGGDSAPYADYARELGIAGSVVFRGKRRDVPAFLSAAALFVLPSRREGMSNALLEAMACAVPCVATDISGSKDLISDGENGLLVPVEDPAALAAAMLKLLGDPAAARRMGEKGRETVKRMCDIGAVAGKYAEAYGKITGTARP
jgi:glycosyltransferase involved in cell wall biosynthesis